MHMIEKKLLFLGLSGLFMLSACGGDIQTNYPNDSEDR